MRHLASVRTWTWGNNTVSTRTYDLDGNVHELNSRGELSTYSYDDAMRITGISSASDPIQSRSYGYDLLDRLTSETGTTRSQAWSYDANGNRAINSGTGGRSAVCDHVHHVLDHEPAQLALC